MARKYSSEYKNLQPYVIEDVRKVVNAVGANGGTGSGSMEVHALSGAYHSGELAQSQASWAATKVELSNHAALPDVHHARAHAITSSSDHTVTGSQYQIVGLTSTNTLGLLTAASSPTTHQVVKTDGSSAVTLVDLTVSSDLFMSGTLDFGTDTMYEDASYLQVTGAKPVRFGQNIGNANWTIYNTGGASFGGSVDITSGGDLTVAGSGSYAGLNVLFADSSGGNVGILRAPDSQLALDIAGPARATYWIGPHAIQLKDVLFLAHYDGRQPFNTNTYGEPNGHMGQVATAYGSVIFRPGMFGTKAVQMAVNITNLVTNPSFETNTTGWSAVGAASISQNSTIDPPYGTIALLASCSGASQGALTTVTGLATTTWHTFSAWVHSTVARTITLHVSDGTHDKGSTATAVAANTWTRLTHLFQTDTHTSVSCDITASGATSLRIDGVQLEARSHATPYCDGSLGGYSTPGGGAAGIPDGTAHAWTGTTHASTSTRTQAGLAYPTAGNINPARGTIMAWVNIAAITSAGQVLLRMAGSSAGNILLQLDTTGKPQGYAGTAGVTAASALTPGTWTHLAMIYDGANVYLYVDGTYVASGASTGFSGVPSTMYVGHYVGSYPFNGLIDDLVILDRAMTINADNSCSELRAVYESAAPVFAETSVFVFRPTPKGLVWADDEGLWMRDGTGKPVFGIYGGESTKSWGGFTMAPGDLLIGNNAVGSSGIWWDQSAGTFGFYGAGSGTAQATVATDGSITAGAGALALNSTGIQITAPSSQTSIGSYKFLVTGKTITSGLYAYYSSGTDTYYHNLTSDSSDIGNITTTIGSIIGGGGTVSILLGLTNSLASTGTTYTLAGGSTATLWIGNGGTNYVGIGTAAAPTRPFQVVGGLFAGGEDTGLSGYVQLTNSTQGVSSGTGTVKMNGATSRNSVGWLKLYSGTTAIYVPYWTTVTG